MKQQKSRLQEKFEKEILPALQAKYPEKNVCEIPKLKKIVISMGIAEAAKDKNLIQDLVKELAQLSGQHPIITKAKISISNFKLREGYPIGLKVTLRKKRMYDFLDRFCNIVCPRIRDFRGFSKKCDGRGNYSVGLTDQQAFPEINLDNVKKSQGMNITFVTSGQTDNECISLLELFAFPFKKVS